MQCGSGAAKSRGKVLADDKVLAAVATGLTKSLFACSKKYRCHPQTHHALGYAFTSGFQMSKWTFISASTM